MGSNESGFVGMLIEIFNFPFSSFVKIVEKEEKWKSFNETKTEIEKEFAEKKKNVEGMKDSLLLEMEMLEEIELVKSGRILEFRSTLYSSKEERSFQCVIFSDFFLLCKQVDSQSRKERSCSIDVFGKVLSLVEKIDFSSLLSYKFNDNSKFIEFISPQNHYSFSVRNLSDFERFKNIFETKTKK